jgi:uncharacterized membrane protein YtjA (UPF0391 family)
MLRWAIVFAIIAVIASALGWGTLEGTSASLARLFGGIFLILFVISLIFGRRALNGPTI